MTTVALFLAAAVAEIGGCFAFWLYFRKDRSFAWLLVGFASLVMFAWLLARTEIAFAGRAYAAYGGIYIAAALLWLYFVEGVRPDRWDLLGVFVCSVGATIIVWGPRVAP